VNWLQAASSAELSEFNVRLHATASVDCSRPRVASECREYWVVGKHGLGRDGTCQIAQNPNFWGVNRRFPTKRAKY